MTVYLCGRHVHPPTDPSAPRDYRCYMCRIEREVGRYASAWMGREPNYRYFSHRQWMYCWTTERMPDGRFAAFVYKPYGKGARSGKATRWKLVKELRFAKRVTAKKRAMKWWETAKRSG